MYPPQINLSLPLRSEIHPATGRRSRPVKSARLSMNPNTFISRTPRMMTRKRG
jgi:hypothetical protein